MRFGLLKHRMRNAALHVACCCRVACRMLLPRCMSHVVAALHVACCYRVACRMLLPRCMSHVVAALHVVAMLQPRSGAHVVRGRWPSTCPTLPCCESALPAPPAKPGALGPPCPEAHPVTSAPGPGPTPAASAPRLGSPLPHLHRPSRTLKPTRRHSLLPLGASPDCSAAGLALTGAMRRLELEKHGRSHDSSCCSARETHVASSSSEQ
jgi:hypothetical protein